MNKFIKNLLGIHLKNQIFIIKNLKLIIADIKAKLL